MRLNSSSETSLSLSRDAGDRQWQFQTQRLDQVSGLVVNVQDTLGVTQVQSRDIWDVLVLSLSFFFLQFERDTSDWTLLDSLHQMGGVTSDLVSQSLGLDGGDLVTQSLVALEIQSQLWIVTLNQSLGSTLDSLSSNSTLLKWNSLRERNEGTC